MKIVFLSNYYNHHQAPISNEIYKILGNDYIFMATMPIPEERRKLGYNMDELPKFVKKSYESLDNNQYKHLINEADIVILGSAPESLIKQRLKDKKLIFRYSERVYKNKKKILQWPLRTIKYLTYNHFSNNVYMLCASAFTSIDYNVSLQYINKCYKWGYFPEVKQYENIDNLIETKEKDSILWTGRIIDLKHPELAIQVAEKLKNDGYNFKLRLIGTGVLENSIKELVIEKKLENYVEFLGSMKPTEVREYMEKSEIFLFTSDFNEGWGAVLNESMNSACAVAASHAIGSVPFLIKDKENGLVYENCDIQDLYNKVKFLLDNPKERVKISKKAYETMITEWNAENAANRLLELFDSVLKGEKSFDKYQDGPCSKAEKIKNNWYK